MIDFKELKKIRQEIHNADEKRYKVMQDSMEIVTVSKKIIYAIHRNDMKSAAVSVADIKKRVAVLKKLEQRPEFENSIKIAMQEYVEALALYVYIKEKRLVTAKELGARAEHYILGLCDLTGEMVRKAVNLAINGKRKEAVDIKEFMEKLYDELLLFNFRNNEIRKKFDSIKYSVKRLEDLAYDLTVGKNAR